MALSDFGRPGAFAPRNIAAISAAVVVVIGAFLLLRGTAPDPPPPAQVVEEPPPPPQEEEPEPAPPPEPNYPTVLVATQDIRPGVLLEPEMVAWQEWREALNVELSVVKDAVDIRQALGAVALHPIDKGSLISFDRVIRPGHPAFITAVLRPGHRAVTVEVDAATTAARIIYPGDHVDVIMVLDGGRFADVGPAAQVLVRNVRVLAVGSSSLELGRFNTAQVAGIGASPTPPEGDTYTLEVTPVDAERLVLGAANGRLTLAMRSLAQRTEFGAGARLTRLGEVLRLPDEGAEDAPPVLPVKVRVIRGGRGGLNTEAVAPPPAQVDEKGQAAPAGAPA